MGKTGGRPKLPAARRRRALRIWASPVEIEELKNRAQQSGSSLSRYLADAGLRKRGRGSTSPAEDKLIYHLGKIGNNLNQLTHLCHLGEIPLNFSQVLESVEDLLREVHRTLLVRTDNRGKDGEPHDDDAA